MNYMQARATTDIKADKIITIKWLTSFSYLTFAASASVDDIIDESD